MFKKRLKGLLAMLLAGSIAATALPLTASAAINGNIAIREGGEQDPNGITQDGIDYGTLDSNYSGCLNASHLWGVYRWPDTGSGYVLESVSGDKLAEKLYEIKTSDTAWNVEIRNSHKVLVTTEKPEPGLSTADAITVDSFPAHFNLPDGFETNNPLRDSTWTVWHGIEDMNTICEYPPLEKYGEPHTISEGSTGIDLSMTDVSGLYSVSQVNFYCGITIIQFQNDYKTFDIPVYIGTGQPEMNGKKLKTIAVTANDDAYLDEGRRFYLAYDKQLIDKSAADTAYTKVSEVWDKIEELAAEANFDSSKLKLIRDVTVTVFPNCGDGQTIYLNSYELAKWSFDFYTYGSAALASMPEAYRYLYYADTKGIWRILPEDGQGYSQKFIYNSAMFEELQNYLQANPTENNIYLYEIDRIYVTGDPDNSMEIGGSLPHEYFYSSPMLVSDPTDEENSTKIQAKISDHAAVLQKNEPTEPGYTYDLNDWQLWGGAIIYGDVIDLEKADISGIERTDSLSLEQLEKISSNLPKPLIYFPQVEIAPSLEVTAPVAGETPSFECTIKDTVGGYYVISVEWYCGNTLLGENDKFEAGKEYTVTIALWANMGLSFVNSTPVTINGKEAVTDYEYDVGFYAYQSFTTDPEKPVNVKATAGNGKVDLSWEDSEGAYGYSVNLYNEDGTLTKIATVQDLGYTVNNLKNGTEYGFVVRAVSAAGAESSYTAEDVVYATPVAPEIPKPQNVKATAGDKQVTVSWDKVDGATKYLIKDGSSVVLDSNITGTSKTFTGLTNGTTYKYMVFAYVNGKWSGASEMVSATPVASTVPQNVKAVAGDKQVTVSWDAVEGATKYLIKDGSSAVIASNITGTSKTFTGLTNGTTYKYTVFAYVNGQWSGASAVVSATPKAVTTVPQNVKAIAGDKQVTVSWDAVSGATKYLIKNGGSTVLASNITGTSKVFTGLTNGTTYKYTVYAYVNGQWSGASAVVSATPKAVTTVPQNVKAIAGDKQVTVSWDAVTGATKYLIKNGGSTVLASNLTGTSKVFTGLTNGTTYKYTVYAYVNGQWSGASAVVSATPKAATTVPQNVKAIAGDKQVTVSWDAVTGATKYLIKNGGSTVLASNITETTKTFTGLTNGTTYKYTVFAYVDGKWSAASEIVSATPTDSIIPQNVKAVAGNKQVTVSWDAVSGATKYLIKNGGTTILASNLTETSKTFTGLTNGTTYKYTVFAYVNGKWSGASKTVSATPSA